MHKLIKRSKPKKCRECGYTGECDKQGSSKGICIQPKVS